MTHVLADPAQLAHFSLGEQITKRKTVRGKRRIGILEQLEDRSVPATFNVINTNDALPANPSLYIGSLRWAVDNANANPGVDAITFNAGLTGTIILAQGPLNFTDTTGATGVNGPGAATLTVSGGSESPIATTSSGSSTTGSGLTLANGRESIDVGGGAVFNAGSLFLLDDVFANNSSVTGNGGAVTSTGLLTIQSSSFLGNSAVNGGAICYASALAAASTITDSTFSNNTASADGGGLRSSGVINISSSTFDHNHASNGGGIVNMTPGSMTIANSNFVANTTSGSGGGLYNAKGVLSIVNSTFTQNTATGTGGGIFNAGTFISGTIPIAFTNSIVAGNTAGLTNDLWGVATPGSSFNIIGTDNTANLTNGVNGNQITDAVFLGSLGNYGGPTATAPLLPGSPALNAGTSSGAPATDQRGVPRVGAVEGDVHLQHAHHRQPHDQHDLLRRRDIPAQWPGVDRSTGSSLRRRARSA